MRISFSSLFFVLSLCFFSFGYGVAAVHYHLWPHPVIVHAKEALDAYLAARRDALQNRPVEFEFPEDGTITGPTVSSHANAFHDNEYIFMDAGVDQFTEQCPRFGCLAVIMDRSGTIVHSWEIDPHGVWSDLDQLEGINSPDSVYSVGAHLYPDGHLLVSFQGDNTYPYGVGLAMFDRDSHLLWKRKSRSHHWFSVDERGYIYTPEFRKIELPIVLMDRHLEIHCSQGGMYQDVIAVLDPDGNEIEVIPLIETFIRSGYTGLLFEANNSQAALPLVHDECDPSHLNDVRVLSAAQTADSALLNAGDLLISMRSMNTVAVLDAKTRLVKWADSGKSVLQHSPRYLGGDRVLLFDNLGGNSAQGGSRLLEIDMNSRTARAAFPASDSPDDVNFFSASGGHIDINRDGRRVLVSLSRQGRLVETDLHSGKILWEFLNTHDISQYYKSHSNDADRFGRFTTQTASYIYDIVFPVNHGRPGAGNEVQN